MFHSTRIIALLAWILPFGFFFAAGEPASAAEPAVVKPGLPQFDGPPPILKPENVQELGRHKKLVEAVAISENGRWLVSCSGDGDCRAWDTKAGRELSRFQEPLDGKKFCVAVANDGKHALIGGEFKAVHVWDITTGKTVFTHKAPEAAVTHVELSDDDKWLMGASADGTLFRYPLLGGDGNLVSMPALKKGVDFLGAAGDGSKIAAGNNREGSVFFVRFPKPGVPVGFFNRAFYVSGFTSRTFERAKLAALGPQGERAAVFRQHLQGPMLIMNLKGGSPYRYETVYSELYMPADLKLISDGKFLAVVTYRAIELRPIKAVDAVTWVDLNLKGVLAAADLTRSGKMLACGLNSKVMLIRLPEFSVSPHERFLTEVAEAWRKADYAKLERFAEAVAHDEKAFAWGGFSKYSTLAAMLDEDSIFQDEIGAGAKRLEEWQAKDPAGGSSQAGSGAALQGTGLDSGNGIRRRRFRRGLEGI